MQLWQVDLSGFSVGLCVSYPTRNVPELITGFWDDYPIHKKLVVCPDIRVPQEYFFSLFYNFVHSCDSSFHIVLLFSRSIIDKNSYVVVGDGSYNSFTNTHENLKEVDKTRALSGIRKRSHYSYDARHYVP